MAKLFYEIGIGQMFTFILWQRGKVAFTKISINSARDESDNLRIFNANDLVETL